MNESYLLSLIERVLELYEANGIVAADGELSEDFKSLIGDMQDATSDVE